MRKQVFALVGDGSRALDLDSGDPGLFGPGSVSWKVHADFTGMMIGGVSALLLQMLHPGALAGVWDHSNFRQNILGRLKNTAQFIAATTYGSTRSAHAQIARVQSIHDRVHGHLPDGTPYSANDPHLLTWVHVAEVTSFLKSYLRYRDPHLSRADQDRYFAETAEIARRLGATDIPTTVAEVESYFARLLPELVCDHRTREVAAALMNHPSPTMLTVPFRRVTMDAGVDLLPDWAARLHGLRLAGPRRHLARAGALGIGNVLRWALSTGSAERARTRSG